MSNRVATAEDHFRKIEAYIDARPAVEKIEITVGIYQLLYDNLKRLAETHDIKLEGKRIFVKDVPLICGHLTPADRAWLDHHKQLLERAQNAAKTDDKTP